MWKLDQSICFISGPRIFVTAQDDDGDDDLVDVEGDADSEETAMTDEGGEGDDGKEGSKSGGSPDAATTVLFTKPVIAAGTTLGVSYNLYITIVLVCY